MIRRPPYSSLTYTLCPYTTLYRYDIVQALSKRAKANASSVSRGDKSGTDAAELRYWKAAGLDDHGKGYKACGCGMGAALNMASSMDAYVLSDRGTWLDRKSTRLNSSH